MARLFSYTIPFDDGAAPNPFHGMCTLVICKPAIRRVAKEGDWVAGLGSKRAPSGDLSGRLVYAMLVDEVIPMTEYDRRAKSEWPHRVPRFDTDDPIDRLGDCIYDFRQSAPPRQRPGVHEQVDVLRDLGGKNALIAREFYYYGKDAIALPPSLADIVHQGRAHKSDANDPYVRTFVRWIRTHKRGVRGKPDKEIEWGPVGAGGGCRLRAKERPHQRVC